MREPEMQHSCLGAPGFSTAEFNEVKDFVSAFVSAYRDLVTSTPISEYGEKAEGLFKQWGKKWRELENIRGAVGVARELLPSMEMQCAWMTCVAYLHQVERDKLAEPLFYSPARIFYGDQPQSSFSLLEAMTILPPNEVRSLLGEDENGKKAKENLAELEKRCRQQVEGASLTSDPYSLCSPISAIATGLTVREILGKSETEVEKSRRAIEEWHRLISNFLIKIRYEKARTWDNLAAFLELRKAAKFGDLNRKLPCPFPDSAVNLSLLCEILSRAGKEFQGEVRDIEEIKSGGPEGSLWLRIAENNLNRLLAEEEFPENWSSYQELCELLQRPVAGREKFGELRFLAALLDHVPPYIDYQECRTDFNNPPSRFAVYLERLLNAETRAALFKIWLRYWVRSSSGDKLSPSFIRQVCEFLKKQGSSPPPFHSLSHHTSSPASYSRTEILLSWLYGTAKDQGDTNFLDSLDQFLSKIEQERL